ncbi:hypothetical protein ACFWZ2_07625 [Streptomyces sp. NPDC059002]|uniref:hypothetical protein n=1 Tax=Streptomyces sp. NPDC059002 TaxID=3346690 RepID=UPI0036CC709D
MLSYNGSGPYCYTHSLRMMIGPDAPPAAVVETLTGAPFGVQLVGGTLPFFDPYGWDPETGLDEAVELLGLRCARSAGGTPAEALGRLRAACAHGPVLAGPVDMGLLLYRPGTPVVDGGDHYVVVLAVEDDMVLLHDPEGHPYATLPTADFVAAWRAEAIAYSDMPFVMRTGFVREREVTGIQALRACPPRAVAWLTGRTDLPVPPGSLGGAAAVEALADQVAEGLAPDVRTLLDAFVVRLGARRLNDAAHCLALLGLADCATVAAGQSRIVGGLQLPLTTGDDRALEEGLRRLAPTYERLRTALAREAAEMLQPTP